MREAVAGSGGMGEALAVGRAVVALARREEITFLAAAIAYYGLVSLVPTVVLTLGVASGLGGPALAERALAVTQDVLTPTSRGLLEDALLATRGRVGATLLGVVVVVWGATKGFRGLDAAFSRLYGTSDARSLTMDLRHAGVGLLAVGAAFLGMVVLGGILAALPLPIAGRVAGLVVLLVGLFAAFLPLYALFPGTHVTAREAAPGAATAAVGWVCLQALFQVYAALTGAGDLYGVLGAVLLLVTWFYLAATLVLVGAILNVVLAERRSEGDRQAEGSAGRGSG